MTEAARRIMSATVTLRYADGHTDQLHIVEGSHITASVDPREPGLDRIPFGEARPFMPGRNGLVVKLTAEQGWHSRAIATLTSRQPDAQPDPDEWLAWPFRVVYPDGYVLHGVQFPSGRCVLDDTHSGLVEAATSISHLRLPGENGAIVWTPAACPEGCPTILPDGHGGCPCIETTPHRTHQCACGTQWHLQPLPETEGNPAP